MQKKLIYGGAILLALAGLAFYLKGIQASPPAQGAVQISYNLCIDAKYGALPVSLDTLAFLKYRTHHWLDSSRQYFGKAYTLSGKDTVLVSVINGLDFRSSSELLLQESGQVVGKKREQNGPIEIFWIWSKTKDGTWWVRHLVVDKQLGSAVLVDHPAKDSTQAGLYFKETPVPKMITRCI